MDAWQGAKYRQSPWNEPEKDLPINSGWYMTLIIWYLTVTYFVLFSLFLWCNIIVMLLGTDSVNSIAVF